MLTFSQDRNSEYILGEILVKFRSGISSYLARKTHGFYGSRYIKRFKRIDVDYMKIPKGWSVEEAISVYSMNPDVEYAEPNYIRRAFGTPDDPDFEEQWGLNNTGQTGGTISEPSPTDPILTQEEARELAGLVLAVAERWGGSINVEFVWRAREEPTLVQVRPDTRHPAA